MICVYAIRFAYADSTCGGRTMCDLLIVHTRTTEMFGKVMFVFSTVYDAPKRRYHELLGLLLNRHDELLE